MYSSNKTSASGMDKYVKGTARSLSPIYYKTAHGYTGSEIIYRKSDSTFDLAKADTSATAEVLGVVVQTEGTDRFALCLEGEISLVAGNFQEGTLTGLVDGSTLFLSATTAGKFTWTEPSTVSYISKPIATVTSINGTIVKCVFNNFRGTTVGGTNLYTTIPLNNGTTTSLQTVNVAAGEGGFIEGVIKIAATANTTTTFKVEFARPITGTAYTCTPQYGCDALPTGSSIDITSGGVIQLTLPSITGFSSGSARFSMQAANVGATLPLQIDGGLVNGPVLGSTSGATVAAGRVGEKIEATRSTATALTAGSNTPQVASIESGSTTLTAGVWAISSCVYFSAGTSVTDGSLGISNQSSAFSDLVIGSTKLFTSQVSGTAVLGITIPMIVVNISSTTQYFTVISATYSGAPSYRFRTTAVRIA